jgi:hypothetical protein
MRQDDALSGRRPGAPTNKQRAHMATLYVANCTRQPHDFLYRVPGEDMALLRRIQIQRIEPGTQQRIHNECPLPVLEAIVEQHRKYGLIPVTEVPNAKAYVGLCYAFDRPVDFERLSYAVDHNLGVLHDRGVQQREEAAVAIDQTIEAVREDARRQGARLAPLRGTDLEVMEDADTPSFGEAVRVDHDIPRSDGRIVTSSKRAAPRRPKAG